MKIRENLTFGVEKGRLPTSVQKWGMKSPFNKGLIIYGVYYWACIRQYRENLAEEIMEKGKVLQNLLVTDFLTIKMP